MNSITSDYIFKINFNEVFLSLHSVTDKSKTNQGSFPPETITKTKDKALSKTKMFQKQRKNTDQAEKENKKTSDEILKN